ncbi:restriction endonuclease subunit S [Oceanobacillus kimchii]|uniref:Restriction endonuclease n=1 Tax=Oceanobacillus kimchii TaxID=746691 RepID=A0ABQ5TQD9_9BACI|nr:restriction endonuclease subunit S [Oceanobacillus kimchii]GLO68066.1 restriction endonuclease [Oceanobacillus kimchii]
MENNRVPEVLFAGFDGEWKEQKLGEIFDVHTDFVSNGSFQALKDNVKLYTQENYAYMIRLQDASNNWKGPWLYTDKTGFDFLKKSTVYENDILMSDRGTIGKFFQVPKLNKPMTLSSNAVLLRSSKNDNSFIYYMLNTKNIKNQIVIRTTPGVQPMISKTEFKKILSSLPLIDEQQKIGSFFKKLDETIALHQQELDTLKQTKQGFLQKMFPKEGETVPEIRFPGFSGEWEERKWSETVDISTNMVDPKTGKFDELPHIGPGNIESFSGRILNNVNNVKEENLISGKFHFNAGDIIYGKINPQLGKYAMPSFNGLASADAYVLKAREGISQSFLFVILQGIDFYKYSVSVSMRTGMPKINRDELNQYSYLSPSIEEQTQIGNFFKQLDDTIALQQKELDALKETKKAFLQKMFI